MNAIVTVNVSQTIAPLPSMLQKTGALISKGGTVTSAGTTSFLSQLSDLTPLQPTAAVVTSLTFSGNVVTAVTAEPHGLPVGDVIALTIAGSVGTSIANGYNGTFACTITGTSGFTYKLPGSTPGGTPSGTWIVADAIELLAMAETFFSQGSAQGVYVLETGVGNAAESISFFSNWLTMNPNEFYSYLVPRSWDSQPGFLSLLDQFESTTAKTYFFTTTTLATYTNYTALQKCCFALIEAPAYGIWSANALTGISYSGSWAANRNS